MLALVLQRIGDELPSLQVTGVLCHRERSLIASRGCALGVQGQLQLIGQRIAYPNGIHSVKLRHASEPDDSIEKGCDLSHMAEGNRAEVIGERLESSRFANLRTSDVLIDQRALYRPERVQSLDDRIVSVHGLWEYMMRAKMVNTRSPLGQLPSGQPPLCKTIG